MGLFTSTELNSVPTTSAQNTVTPYAQPLASNVLDKANALTNAPTPVYTGQLTAGYAPLQQQAWQGLSSLTLPSSLTNAGTNLNDISQQAQNLSYNPNTITASQFDATQAQKYMNPYIQASLDPQLAALQRQQAINQQGDLAKLTQAGAYGGSRQAILQGQNNENLLRQQNQLIGSGYNQAYQNATQQFNADAARDLQAQQLNQAANQFGATYGLQGLQAATQAQTAAGNAGAQQAQYGLQNLQAMNKAGTEQQSLDQQALNAQYNEYLRQLKYPTDMLTLDKSILAGLPITTTNTYGQKPSISTNVAGGVSLVSDTMKKLQGMGMSMPDISKYINNLTKSNPAATGGVNIDANGNLVYPKSPSGGTPYDDNGNLMPGWSYDENNNPVWVSANYIEPPQYPAQDTTTTTNDTGTNIEGGQ
jgi:hypothetical protein